MMDNSGPDDRQPGTGSSPRKPRPRGRKPSGRKPTDGKPKAPEERKPGDQRRPPQRRPSPSRPGPRASRQRHGTRRPHSLKSSRPQVQSYQLIVNTLAGIQPDLSIKLAKKLDRNLKKVGYESTIHETATWDEFTQQVIKSLRERPYALIVFGGDGSVRMAASRVARAKGLLGIVPCGQYNNIFRSLYGHNDAETALDIVRSEYQMRIDAGLANGNFFLGSLISGLVPNIIARLGRKKLPRLGLTWSKLLAHAANDTMPLSTMMKVDTFTFKAQPLILNIHILSHLMTLRFAPAAVPDDGRVALIYDGAGTRDTVIHYLRDLKKERHQYSDMVQILRGTRVSITPAKGRKWLIDGDEIEFTGEEIGIEVLNRILRVFSNAPEKS